MASADVSKKYLPWLDGFAGSLNVIALVLGGLFVIQGRMTIGDLVAFNGFLWMLNMPMRMSGWLINDVQRFTASSIKIRQLLATKPKIPIAREKEAEPIQGYVTFDHVSFHFSDDPETPILSDVSFSAKPGETIGILGETGSGKTTLVNLIARFYDPTKGTVYIDGKDAKSYSVRKLRENISMVMQDVFLFSNTIEDNIAFGNTLANLEQVQMMAEIADAHSFISRMPEGYATIVGERGVGLSGGQKQRISLELGRLTEKKTTFIIAHRISSVREANLILMMEKGRVVESGTHSELVEQKGKYFDVYQKQLGLTKEGESRG